jgi:adenylate cyclase
VDTLTRDGVAERAGVAVAYVDHLVELGVLAQPMDGSPFSSGDVRRVRLIRGMEQGGLPLEGIAAAVRNGDLSLAFLDLPSWDWYGGFSGKTYGEVSAEVGIGVELLLALRESMGFGLAEPDDFIHEEELSFIPVVKVVVDAGVDPEALERLVRVWGDSLRRMTEAAANFYHAQIELPLLRSGMSEGQMMQVANETVAAGIAPLDRALVAMYHGHSERTWLGNVIESVEAILEKRGLHHTATRPPAMCFLDLSGYTRLTEERGDAAAAEMAATLGGLVQRSASEHGGRPVKWLGDGVMLYFPEPSGAVLSALDMREWVPSAGLPPAHTGIDAGPVIRQDGDYFGRTVNTAARIAAHAGPGEVLVSDAVERSVHDARVSFEDAGLVELKGSARPIRLHRVAARG